MTANYRTRLIGIAHRHLLKNPDIVRFFELENANKGLAHIRFQKNIPEKPGHIVLRISLDDGFRFFVLERGMLM